MSPPKSLMAFAATLSLITASAALDSSAKSNVAVYYGQGASQPDLATFCVSTSIDIIQLGFVDIFPQQGNGFPGTNFGNQCWGSPYVYAGPGDDPSKDSLQTECPTLAADILTCQALGKTILLSLGGQVSTENPYQLTGEEAGVEFAEFLWGAFGPRQDAWVEANLPRPFDIMTWDGLFSQEVVIDGFDLDIEAPSTDGSAGYIALLATLRSLFSADESKTYYLSAAPQCSVPDTNMAAMISAVPFDFVWVQFYNTPQCSARAWVNANETDEINNPFTYDSWTTFLTTGASKDAKLFIGLLGSSVGTDVSDTNLNYYLHPEEAELLIQSFYSYENFGGVMIWEATLALENVDGLYYDSCKAILNDCAPKPVTSSTVILSTISASQPPSSTAAVSTTSVSPSTVTVPTISKSQPSSSIPTVSTISTPQASSTSVPSASGFPSYSQSGSSLSVPLPTGSSIPVGTGGSSTLGSSSAPYPIGTGSSSASFPSGTGFSSSAPPFPTGAGSTSIPIPSGTGPNSAPFPFSSGTVSNSSVPSPSSTGFHSSAPFPSGTGVSSSRLPSVPIVTGTGVSSSGSSSVPFGNSTGNPSGTPYSSGFLSSAPFPSGTGFSSSLIPTGTGFFSSSRLSLSTGVPLPTGTGPSSAPSSNGTSSVTVTPFPTSVSSSIIPSGTGVGGSSAFPSGTGSSIPGGFSSVPFSNGTSITSVTAFSSAVSSSIIPSGTGVSSSSSSALFSSATSSVSVTPFPSSILSSTMPSGTGLGSSSLLPSGTTIGSSGGSSLPPFSNSTTTSVSIATFSTGASSSGVSSSVGGFSSSGSSFASITNSPSPTSSSSSGSSVPAESGSASLKPSPSQGETFSSSSGPLSGNPGSGITSSANSPFPTYTSSFKNWNATKPLPTISTISTSLLPFPSESTVWITKTYTITSCAPTITDCPARIGSITTEIIPSVTTYTASITETLSLPSITETASLSSITEPTSLVPFPSETISTIIITKTYTITSCAQTIIDCPARIGSVTTELITTVVTVPCTETNAIGGSGSSPFTSVSIPSSESSPAAAQPALQSISAITITETQTLVPIQPTTSIVSPANSSPTSEIQEISTTTLIQSHITQTHIITVGFAITTTTSPIAESSALSTSIISTFSKPTWTGSNIGFGNTTIVGTATSGFLIGTGTSISSIAAVSGTSEVPSPTFTGGSVRSLEMRWIGLVIPFIMILFLV